jgi:[glutamine synthetase] adenylyltransferase / [glutamine synthetase]-adenylyl-L-tyrosine phosphorylase
MHGDIVGGEVAIVALGKLGGREMTAASDLDLIVIYNFDANSPLSTGPKPLSAVQYYARYTQRLISAFTAPTAEGALYEIDMRLRPSGNSGPVAAQLASFISYQAKEAWTWEHMALTRARVVAGAPALSATIEHAIKEVLSRPRDRLQTALDVRDMRARITQSKGTVDPWDLKQVRGGLVDIEFIAQYLQLINAADHPRILDQTTEGALRKLADVGLVGPADATVLLTAVHRLNSLTQVLRLSLIKNFEPLNCHDGLKRLLAHVGGTPTFDILAADLIEQHANVAAVFDRLVV